MSLAEFRRGRLLLGPISNIFRASRAKTRDGKNGSRSWPLADSSILKAPIHTRLAIKLHRETRVRIAASLCLAYNHQESRTLECKCVLNTTSGIHIEQRWHNIMLSTQHRSFVPCSYLHGIWYSKKGTVNSLRTSRLCGGEILAARTSLQSKQSTLLAP